MVSYDRIVHLAKCQDLDDDSNAWLLIFVEEGDGGEISKVGAISSPKAKSFNMETSNKSQVECLKVASDKNNAMDDKDKETKWWTCEPKGHISDGVDNNDI